MVDLGMATKLLDRTLSPADVAAARQRRLAGQNLQAIESNPLDAEQIEMFEMFEREAWTHERRRAYITNRIKARISKA